MHNFKAQNNNDKAKPQEKKKNTAVWKIPKDQENNSGKTLAPYKTIKKSNAQFAAEKRQLSILTLILYATVL